MGWKLKHRPRRGVFVLADGNGRVVAAWSDANNTSVHSGWNPLLSLADAWMLVEALKDKQWSFRYGNNACAPSQHAVAFAKAYRGLGANILTGEYIEADMEPVVADTAPRAIVLAALRAVGVPA
ncbi:MAG: hypothetical protein LLG20_18285 [Acidobacteriales bacterium]|nr:hypothetical protein [Terriglobales bacterium]